MIFYFSGTGNTRWVATRLAEAVGETAVDICGEPDNGRTYTLTEGERIGFCFPVHGWQPPEIMLRFISKMQIRPAGGHYCFAVCTCGDETGKAVDILNSHLRRRHLHADSAFSIVMPNTYVALPFMNTDGAEAEAAKTSNAGGQTDAIIKAVEAREGGVYRLREGAFPRLLSYVLGNVFHKTMMTDRPFRADADTCTGCGRCAKACPVGNITLTESRTPEWRHDGRCTCCLACYHHCPTRSIAYGRFTKGKGQYYFGKTITTKPNRQT